MRPLDAAWSVARLNLVRTIRQLASTIDALDLASALIKLSRLAPTAPLPGLTTPLVNNSVSSLNTRVERLISWDKPEENIPSSRTFWVAVTGITAALVTIAASYTTLLVQIHELTEFMVR